MDKIQMLIISSQSLFSQGIEHAVVANTPDIEVRSVNVVNDQILVAIDDMAPDVALLDIDGVSEEDGLMLGRRIKQHSPSIGVIMLTSNLNDAQLFQALKAQAVAYLGKEVTVDRLVEVVRRVARGEHPINESLTTRPKVAEQVLNQFQDFYWQSEADTLLSPLTRRETEILNYIAKGLLNKQIAAQLGISEQTIKNHVTSILRKLNANARTEAVVLAIKQGLISIR